MRVKEENSKVSSRLRFLCKLPPRRALSRVLGGDGHVVGLAGKGRDRANVGLTRGWNTRHSIKAPYGEEGLTGKMFSVS